MEGDSNLHTCPYLGLSSHASISRLVATSAHRCHRWATPQTVEKEHQVTFCLNDNHINCPWFVRPGGNFSSRREHYNPVSRKQRLVGTVALLSVLLLAFIAAKMVIWPTFFGGDQQKVAGGVPVVIATSAPAGSAAAPIGSAAAPTATPPPTAVQSTAVPVAAQPTTTSALTATRAISTAVTPRPTGTPSPTARPQITPPAGGQIYEVQSGDTLYGLATAHGITVEDIMKANGLTDRASLRVGQKLIIPPAQ